MSDAAYAGSEEAAGARRWESVGQDEVAYQGFLRIVHRRLRLPDGRETVWDLVDLPPTVAVLPLTPDGLVVMVRQFRVGPARAVTSIPGGLLDPGEDVVSAAARELREETGYAGRRLEHVASAQLNSHTQPHHVALAYDCRPAHTQELDDFEDCEVVLLAPRAVRDQLRSGRLGAGLQTYLALDHAGLL